MRKIIVLLLCSFMVLCGCSAKGEESTVCATTFSETTISQNHDNLIAGNIDFLISNDQTVQNTGENANIVWLTPKCTAVSVHVSEANDWGHSIDVGAYLQNKTWEDISPSKKDVKNYDHTFMGNNITLVGFTSTDSSDNAPFKILTTFYDETYIYSLLYVSNTNDGTEIQKFIDFLNSATSLTDKCIFTSVNQTAATNNHNYYQEGMYKVGSDISSGEYLIVATSSIPAYFALTSDSSGNFDSLIANDNFVTFTYITVSDGQYLKVERAQFVDALSYQPSGADENGYYKEGMYKVGRDIPAGEYKVESTSNTPCYIEVRSDSSHTFDSLIHNENTNSNVYINVSDGQYLTVNRGKFKPE